MSNLVASNGKEVQVLYTGKLKDGLIFDSNNNKEPLKFVIGQNNILPDINNAIIGMKIGDKKVIEIMAINGYGLYNKKLLITIPKINIPENTKQGDMLSDANKNSWFVRQIEQDFIVLDGNHPLAGHDLIFEIELIAIS